MKTVLVRPLLLIALCTVLNGCVYNRAYRTYSSGRSAPIYSPNYLGCPTNSPEDTSPPKSADKAKVSVKSYTTDLTSTCAPFYQAYIEFDEFGQMWDDGNELHLALSQIDYAKQHGETFCNGVRKHGNGSIHLVVFVHGWKNNASEKSGNVLGFRDELGAIAHQECNGGNAVPVVGVYIGWRGDWVHWEAFRDLVSYWDRRNVAQKLPGAHLTEVLNDLEDAAHRGDSGASKSKIVLIGHSFGAQVLERAITPIMVQNMQDQLKPGSSEIQKPKFDLVILINPAASAVESVQMLTYLKAHRLRYCRAGMTTCTYADSLPLIVTLKSKGDWATGFVMWAGQSVSLATQSARDYSPADALADPSFSLPPNITNQSVLFSDGPVSVPEFRSHVVYPCSQFPNAPYSVRFPRLDLSGSTPHQQDDYYCIAPRALDKGNVDKKLAAPWNDTPFWIAELPVEIVPDHTTVFGPELELMINALMKREIDPNANSMTIQ